MKVFVLVFVILVAGACRSSQKTRGIIVVNAPAGGVVRRVLASEGSVVQAGAPVVEIVVSPEGTQPVANNNTNTAVIAEQQAQQRTAAAQSEVERTAVEVQRVELLVSSGRAPQAQLDAARADYEHAQERLQQVKSQSQTPGAPPPNVSPTQAETIVVARASASGTLSVINARPGQRVASGQPIASISQP